MCIIIGIAKTKQASPVSIASIKQAVVEAQKRNSNGSAVVAWKGQNITHKKSMKMSKDEIGRYIDENDKIVFHFRIATVGSVKLKNCHLWEKENWYFAHNGFSRMTSKKDNADSFEVMGELWKGKAVSAKKVKAVEVKRIYRDCGLTGKTIFVKPELNKIVMTGDYNVYGIETEMLVFASGVLTFGGTKKMFGFEFEDDSAIKVLESDMSGMNVFENNRMRNISDDSFSGGYGEFGQYNPVSKGQMKLIKEKNDKTIEDYYKKVAEQVDSVIVQQENVVRSSWETYPNTKNG